MVIFHSFLYVYQRVPKKLRSPLFFGFSSPVDITSRCPGTNRQPSDPKATQLGKFSCESLQPPEGWKKPGFTGKHIASTCHFLWREFTRQFICRNKKAVKTSWCHQQPWGVATTVKILIWQIEPGEIDGFRFHPSRLVHPCGLSGFTLLPLITGVIAC